jgi:hypothetical protein
MVVHYKLVETRPDLVAQWHPTKNAHLDLATIGLYSNKVATWVCPKHGEWPAVIANRTRANHKCPKCSGKVATPENNFARRFPELVKEWHPIKNKFKPTEYTPFSSKKIWWLCCKCNYEWEEILSRRTSSGAGCPCCAKRKIESNCLAIKYPKLLTEWDWDRNHLSPYTISPQSTQIVLWICKHGHESYPSRVSHKVNGHGCPKCNNQDSKLQLFFYYELQYFYNDVQYKYKIDGKECDIYLPSYKVAVEIDAYRWHKDKLKQEKIKAKTLEHLGITLISIRENKLAKVSPHTVRYTNNDAKLDICKKLIALLYKLTRDKRLLAYKNYTIPINEETYLSQIANYPAPPRENTLAKINPMLASEWDYGLNGTLTPYDVCPNSHEKVWWLCLDGGHGSWRATIANRHRKGYGCRKCYDDKRRHKNDYQNGN